ncbi:MAG: 3'-5' exonuclease [Myxococcota bacterium]|nr:3'-5' exonuclease [Myxococcota bacterium]
MGATALFSHHVFVDLETTGLDPCRDRVIEVGAVFVERGEVVARVTQLCDPGMEIPAEVVDLTGIHPAQVRGQPSFEQFLSGFGPRLAGWTLVAHNAEFERSFFAGLFERLAAPVLDSCELVHYLHPELASHSLDSLVRWTGLGEAARHRALPDCEDTYAVLTRILDGVVAQRRTEDVGDLLQCLSTRPGEELFTEPPLVTLLRGLYRQCHAAGSQPVTEWPGSPLGYEERASRAYLRAFQRRCVDASGAPGLSSWFKRRYPALTLLAPPPPG